jgi:hypothetical protein
VRGPTRIQVENIFDKICDWVFDKGNDRQSAGPPAWRCMQQNLQRYGRRCNALPRNFPGRPAQRLAALAAQAAYFRTSVGPSRAQRQSVRKKNLIEPASDLWFLAIVA